MTLTKVTFTTVDDVDGEKNTIITEFGPFDSTSVHPIEAFYKWLQDREGDETPKIITKV